MDEYPITNRMAIVSLILAISNPALLLISNVAARLFSIDFNLCALLSFSLSGPIAVVTGIISRRQIRNSNDMEKGKGIAWAGIVMGGLFTLLGICYATVIFFVIPYL